MTIASPGSGTGAPFFDDCSWMLDYGAGNVHDISVTYGWGDPGSHLQIHDGNSTAAPMMLGVSKIGLPSVLRMRSTQQYLAMRYVGGPASTRGSTFFSVKSDRTVGVLNFCPPAFRTVAVGGWQVWTPPTSPYIYHPNFTCYSTVNTTSNNYIRLVFGLSGQLRLAPGDSITVYEGADESAPVAAVYNVNYLTASGSPQFTQMLYVHSSVAYIKIVSGLRNKWVDFNGGERAYLPQIEYTAVPAWPTTCRGAPTIQLTGATLSFKEISDQGSSSFFPSPIYDARSLDGSTCEYVYDAGSGMLAKVFFPATPLLSCNLYKFYDDTNGVSFCPPMPSPQNNYVAAGRTLRLRRKRDPSDPTNILSFVFSAYSPAPLMRANGTVSAVGLTWSPTTDAGLSNAGFFQGVPPGTAVRVNITGIFGAFVQPFLFSMKWNAPFSTALGNGAKLRWLDSTTPGTVLQEWTGLADMDTSNMRINGPSILFEFVATGWTTVPSMGFTITGSSAGLPIPDPSLLVGCYHAYPTSGNPMPPSSSFGMFMNCTAGQYVQIFTGYLQLFRPGIDNVTFYNGSSKSAPVFAVFDTYTVFGTSGLLNQYTIPQRIVYATMTSGPGNTRGAAITNFGFQCISVAIAKVPQPCNGVTTVGVGFNFPALPSLRTCDYLFPPASTGKGWNITRSTFVPAHALEQITVLIYNGSGANGAAWVDLSLMLQGSFVLVPGSMFMRVQTGVQPNGDLTGYASITPYDASVAPPAPCLPLSVISVASGSSTTYRAATVNNNMPLGRTCEWRFKAQSPLDFVSIMILDWGLSGLPYGSYIQILEGNDTVVNITAATITPFNPYLFAREARVTYYADVGAQQTGPVFTVSTAANTVRCQMGMRQVVNTQTMSATYSTSAGYSGPINYRCSLRVLAVPGYVLLPVSLPIPNQITTGNYYVLYDGFDAAAPVIFNTTSALISDYATVPATTSNRLYLEMYFATTYNSGWSFNFGAKPFSAQCNGVVDGQQMGTGTYTFGYFAPNSRCNFTILPLYGFETSAYSFKGRLMAGDRVEVWFNGIVHDLLMGPWIGSTLPSPRHGCATISIVAISGSMLGGYGYVDYGIAELMPSVWPSIHCRSPGDIMCSTAPTGYFSCTHIDSNPVQSSNMNMASVVSFGNVVMTLTGSTPFTWNTPNLRRIISITFGQSGSSPNNFPNWYAPVLQTIGSFTSTGTVQNLQAFNFPSLVTADVISISNFPQLKNITAPLLTNVNTLSLTGGTALLTLPSFGASIRVATISGSLPLLSGTLTFSNAAQVVISGTTNVSQLVFNGVTAYASLTSIATVSSVQAPNLQSIKLVQSGATNNALLNAPQLTQSSSISTDNLGLNLPQLQFVESPSGAGFSVSHAGALAISNLRSVYPSLSISFSALTSLDLASMDQLIYFTSTNNTVLTQLFLCYADNLASFSLINSPLMSCGDLAFSYNRSSTVYYVSGCNATMNGTQTRCPLRCADPGPAPLLGSRFLPPHLIVGSKVNFTCSAGLYMAGSASITCLANQTWSDSVPQCLMYCPDPGTPVGGTRFPVTGSFTVGAVVVFNCSGGLVLNGAAAITCFANATWSDVLPICLPPTPPPASAPPAAPPGAVTCPDPGVPTHGSRLPALGPVTFPALSVVLFWCDQGYTMQGGEDVMECLSTGVWNDTTPYCTLVPEATVAQITIDGIVPSIVALQTAATIQVYGSNWLFPLQQVLGDGVPVTDYTIISGKASRRVLSSGPQIEFAVIPHSTSGYYNLQVIDAAGAWVGDDVSLFFTNDCPTPGTYGVGTDCHPCPVGGYCPGGNRVWPLPGYWNGGEGTGYALPCPEPPSRCIGGRTAACAQGYIGPVCGGCDPGYYVQGTQCVKCPGDGELETLLIVAIIFYLFIAFSFCTLSDQGVDNLVTLIKLLQLIRAGTTQTGARLPDSAQTALYYLSLTSFDFSFVKPACGVFADASFDFLFWGNAILILAFVLPTHIALGVAKAVMPNKRAFFTNRMYRAVTVQVSLLYLSIATRTVESVACVKIGDTFRLLAQPTLDCKPSASLIVGAIGLLVVTIGTPVGFFFFVHRLVSRGVSNDPINISRYGFLYGELRTESNMHGYIPVPYIHLFLTAIAWSTSKTGVTPYIIVLCSFVFALTITIAFRPFRQPFENAVLILSYALGLASLLLGFLSLTSLTSSLSVAYSLCAVLAVLGVLVAVFVLLRGKRVNRVEPEKSLDTEKDGQLTGLREIIDEETIASKRNAAARVDSSPFGVPADDAEDGASADEYEYEENSDA